MSLNAYIRNSPDLVTKMKAERDQKESKGILLLVVSAYPLTDHSVSKTRVVLAVVLVQEKNNAIPNF